MGLSLQFYDLVKAGVNGHYVAWDEDWEQENWIELSESMGLSPDMYAILE
jgi:hypothetical protein